MRKRKYGLILPVTSVNVSSSGHYFVDVCLRWGNRRRVGHYLLMDDTLVFQPQRGRLNRGISEVRKYPQYLRREILESVQERIDDGQLMFYEYNRDGVVRSEGLRYHDENGYQYFCGVIASRLGI